MKKVTRNIDFDRARDLLERVPRACLTYASDTGPQLWPVELLWQEGRYLVYLPSDSGCRIVTDQEAVLLVDEGIYYFELRAIYIRGQITQVEAPSDAPDGFKWFEMVPSKIVAWDYGTMREAESES